MDSTEDNICIHVYKNNSRIHAKGSRCTQARMKQGGVYCWVHKPRKQQATSTSESAQAIEQEIQEAQAQAPLPSPPKHVLIMPQDSAAAAAAAPKVIALWNRKRTNKK